MSHSFPCIILILFKSTVDLMVKILFSFSLLKRGCCHLFLASAAPRLAPYISVITNCCIQCLFTVKIFLFCYISEGSLPFLALSLSYRLSLGITSVFILLFSLLFFVQFVWIPINASHLSSHLCSPSPSPTVNLF